MITQAIKRWLEKLFGWFSGKPFAENEYAPVTSPLNKSVTQESIGRSTSDNVPPQQGVAQRIVGQGEISCSTVDEWRERATQHPGPPPVSAEKSELPVPPPQIPVTPPVEKPITALDTPPTQGKTSLPTTPPPTPTPEQKLEFLHYLVQRGIVNEGFAEGQVPEQYRRY
jgi:hypothetical protein